MFYKLKHTSKTTGMSIVFVGYKYGGKDTIKSTGVSVLRDHFNTKTGKVSKQDAEHVEKQAKISRIKALFESVVSVVAYKGGNLSARAIGEAYDQTTADDVGVVAELEELREAGILSVEQVEAQIAELERQLAERKDYLNSLKRIFTPNYGTPLHEKVSEYVKLDVQNYKANTLAGYRNLAALVKEFSPTLPLEELNLEQLSGFQKFLINKEMRNRSIRVILTRLKTVFRYFAEALDLPTAFFTKFVMVKEKANDNTIYLTNKELEDFAAIELDSPHQYQVQQQFLFAAETALRHSDLYVTLANVKGGELQVTMKKSDKTVFIPLTAKARAIIYGPNFPFKRIPANQYNKALQTICKRLEIFRQPITLTHYIGNEAAPITKEKWELMSSHVGRKTAINAWLAAGVAESVVVQWAGHTDNKMLQKHYQNKKAASEREAQKLLL
jgi:integrase/cell division protein FtsB